MRQQEVVLSVANNIVRVTLQFKCTRMTILNNTSNPLYINRSSTQPTSTSRDYVVLAAVSGFPGNVQLPQNSFEYCFFLPLTPTLTDTSAVIVIQLQGDDIQTRNYREVILNALDVKKN